MKHIEALNDNGGEITLSAIYPIKCAATAADGHNSVAMLVRREGKTLNALLKRLDKAISRYFDDDEFIDEVNGAEGADRRQDGLAGRLRCTGS